MIGYILSFSQVDKTKLALVGGKGANLGELFAIPGVDAPDGFCVTTCAYKKITENDPQLDALSEELALLNLSDIEKISEVGTKIRKAIEQTKIPEDIASEVASHLLKLGEDEAYAVRSSATAEDLPTASFAGQQDTYLNVIGKQEILTHISKCWASLYTDRAIIYRIQNGFEHHKVHLSVIVQKMIFPDAAGIIFTADPVTSNRKVVSIDASFGLGESTVSGTVNSDNYTVRDGVITGKKVFTKKLAVYGLKKGGTEEREIAPEKQNAQALTDKQILHLEKIGRTIEAYFGCPQDIEWCLNGEQIVIVQSRPITTLFPLPEETDGKNHVYVSFGHQQMMTNAIKPLGLSILEKIDESFAMTKAGGRFFIDVAQGLSTPMRRKVMIPALGKMDPLISSSIKDLTARDDFMKSISRGKMKMSLIPGYLSFKTLQQFLRLKRRNNVADVEELMEKNEREISELRKKMAPLSGKAAIDAVYDALNQTREAMYIYPRNMATVFVGVYALGWINKKMDKWLGEKNVGDVLCKSVPNNVTSEMGMELLDVADVVRQYPAVMDYFADASNDTFFEDLSHIEGGKEVSLAIKAYLEKYGMRCTGEIDITRTRFSEAPTALIPLILGNIKNFEPGAHQSIFEQGRQESLQKEEELLSRLTKLSGGKRKVKKTKRMISQLQSFIGYREYPKYIMVGYYWVIKQALLREAQRLVSRGVIRKKEDIFFLYLDELQKVVDANELDYNIIEKRKSEHEVNEKLTTPRAMTSEGEVLFGKYESSGIPDGAIAGVAVSSGTIEGRARVILRMEDIALEDGDILVTAFTDPSWTPVFVSIKGLVTEVGGMMTHGSVVAREYGLPAVVGVENATKLIKDGQRIRLNGTEGYIEILSD